MRPSNIYYIQYNNFYSYAYMYVYIHAFTCMKKQNLWDLQTCIFFSLEKFFNMENKHCKNPKYFVYPKGRWNYLKIRIVSLWMCL